MTYTNGRPETSLWRDATALALLLTASLKIMANATISPALPALEASFSGEPGAAYLVRFLVSAPSMTVVLVAPLAGLAIDRFGRSWLLMAGVLVFALSGSAGAYLNDLTAILVSRLLLGGALAFTMTAQVALAGDLFQGNSRSAFMGGQVVAINFGGFLFIGGAGLLAGVSPRLPFLIYALPLLLLPLLWPVMKQEYRNRKTAHDVPTSLTSAGTKVSAAKAGSWLVYAFGLAGLSMVTVMIFFLMPSQLPFYLEASGFDGATGTALGLGALTLSGAFTALKFAAIRARLGLPITFSAGFLIMGCGFATLAMYPAWEFIIPGCALIGVGYAFVQPALFLAALDIAPAARRGTVSGMITTSMFLGQIVSPFVFTPALQSYGFVAVYGTCGAAFVVFASLALAVRFFRPARMDVPSEPSLEKPAL
ncbi:MFS transporter [Roseibium sp.]|uniref:MFS transporter n=1 Tax=Roseibium sp. TaxID=1936156 RepID=UPI003919EED0